MAERCGPGDRARTASGAGAELPPRRMLRIVYFRGGAPNPPPSARFVNNRGQVTASRATPPRIERLLAALESARRERADQAGVEAVLAKLEKVRFREADALLRFHDALLYLAAFPSRPTVRRRAARTLRTFAERVTRLDGGDVSALEEAGHSGVAETSVTTTFSFDLLRSFRGRRLEIDWDLQENADRLGAGLARFLPLLEEESLVDANVPYAAWVAAARNAAWLDAAQKGDAVSWLLARFEGLPFTPAERAERFDALGLSVRWDLGRSPWSRTALRVRSGPAFFHRRALLSRGDVDLRKEIGGPALPVRRLAAAAGLRTLDAARAALATRYREFYGFNHGDAARTIEVDGGRGIRLHFFGLPPARRLPLRAAAAFLISRNGVPVGYGDGFVLFERIDLSFNVFPEYRDGETAFIFARLLRACRRLFGATVFSIDPYQIGFGNDEAIESGAFWFYRRLGFRSASPAVEGLAVREEGRLAKDRGYRSSPRVLRELAGSGVILDAEDPGNRAWDRFHIRNIGLAVERRMAASGLPAPQFLARSAARLARIVPSRPGRHRPRTDAFASLAAALDLVPGLARWSAADLGALAKILDAKSSPSERSYMRLLQRHDRLRTALLRLGSASSSGAAARKGSK